MPQIDFGHVFETDISAKPGEPLASSGALSASFAPLAAAPAELTGSSRLVRGNWANASFVAMTLGGGLFCAFYFFNGVDLLRAAAAWPAEFLYKRPAEFAFAKIDNRETLPVIAASPTAPIQTSEPGPFRRSTASLLGLEPPSPAFASAASFTNSTAANLPNGIAGPSGPLDGLSGNVPNGDSLTQTLTDESDTLAQTANETASQAPETVAQPTRRPIAAAKKIVRRVKSQTASAKKLTARASSKTAANTVTSTARSTSSIGSVRGINSAGAIGGINGNGGAVVGRLGGVGGINGGGGGGIGGINGGGGGIGGFTGAVHGILGGRH